MNGVSKKRIVLNLRIILSLSVLILFFGCEKSAEKKIAIADVGLKLTKSKHTRNTLTGRILDESTKNYFVLNNIYGREEISIDHNQFAAEFEHDFPQIIELIFEYNVKYPVFIAPGDSIHLEYYENDLFNNFSKISFSGDHSEENNLLLQLKGILKYDNTNNNKFFNCSEENFLFKIDSIQGTANDILQRFKVKQRNKNFETLAQSYIDFKIGNYLEMYPRKMEYAFKQGSMELSESYLTKKNGYLLKQSHHINNISFSNYASGIIEGSALKKFNDENYDKKGRMFVDLNTTFSSIDSTFKNKAIIDHLKFKALAREIYLIRKKPESFYKLYQTSNPASGYLRKLEEILLEINIPDKDYVFKDMDGNDRYLSEFKDKIIYIDIWATWCWPCLQERKYFEELIEKFSDRKEDIVFLGISIDTDIRKWRSLVTVKDMKGVQLLSPQGFDSEICKDFGINGIPRFMILNRRNEFIEPNAMRPSQEEIYNYLDQLIEAEI